MAKREPQRISVGILRRGSEVWIQRRKTGTHLAGHWEFPGGKVETGESPRGGLYRELREEVGLGLDPHELRLLWVRRFRYPDRELKLFFYLVEIGDAKLSTPGRWCSVDELESFPFPPANRPIISWLMRSC